MSTAIFPGSFDPPTRGHLDLIGRAAAIFDRVIVAVAINPAKANHSATSRRVALVEKACQGMPNVRVTRFSGLVADYATTIPGSVIVRGLRSVTDYLYEQEMAQLNRGLGGHPETLFLASAPELAHISSSRVREIARLGGDICPLVPQQILADIVAAYGPDAAED